MRTASSARRTVAAVGVRIGVDRHRANAQRRQVAMTRQAISPRLAMRIVSNIADVIFAAPNPARRFSRKALMPSTASGPAESSAMRDRGLLHEIAA